MHQVRQEGSISHWKDIPGLLDVLEQREHIKILIKCSLH